jgi:uncharacterized protein involved in tolerance to divalent cations
MRDLQPLVVLVTAPSEAVGLDLGRTLADERLAACVNLVRGLPVAESAPAHVQWVRESIPIEGG